MEMDLSKKVSNIQGVSTYISTHLSINVALLLKCTFTKVDDKMKQNLVLFITMRLTMTGKFIFNSRINRLESRVTTHLSSVAYNYKLLEC